MTRNSFFHWLYLCYNKYASLTIGHLLFNASTTYVYLVFSPSGSCFAHPDLTHGGPSSIAGPAAMPQPPLSVSDHGGISCLEQEQKVAQDDFSFLALETPIVRPLAPNTATPLQRRKSRRAGVSLALLIARTCVCHRSTIAGLLALRASFGIHLVLNGLFITGVESEDRESVWQSAARLNSSNRAVFQRENGSGIWFHANKDKIRYYCIFWICFNILLLSSRFVCHSLWRSCDFLSGPLGRTCPLCDIRILPLPAFFSFFLSFFFSCGNLVWLECCFIQILLPPFPWEAPKAESLVSSGGNLHMFVNAPCGCRNQQGPALQTFRHWIFIKSGFSPETAIAGASLAAALCRCGRLRVIEFGVFFASVGVPLGANSRSMAAVCAECFYLHRLIFAALAFTNYRAGAPEGWRNERTASWSIRKQNLEEFREN